ncbi:hypothetical protein FRB96_002802 [Tulasnella sp. 330]|nr:hypothetical protein FRB96_002802 [Tulasnella sp. 330]KAG8877963.1 hypothetical protein FRB97_002888 [Tulasnella sp. 331]
MMLAVSSNWYRKWEAKLHQQKLLKTVKTSPGYMSNIKSLSLWDFESLVRKLGTRISLQHAKNIKLLTLCDFKWLKTTSKDVDLYGFSPTLTLTSLILHSPITRPTQQIEYRYNHQPFMILRHQALLNHLKLYQENGSLTHQSSQQTPHT